MNARLTGVLVVRLFAVWVVVVAIGRFSEYGFFFWNWEQKVQLFLLDVTFNLLFHGLLAVALWKYADRLVPAAISNEQSLDAGEIGDARIIEIGALLLGIYTLIFGLEDLVYFASLDIASSLFAEANNSGYESAESWFADAARSATRIALASALIFGRRHLSRWAVQARNLE